MRGVPPGGLAAWMKCCRDAELCRRGSAEPTFGHHLEFASSVEPVNFEEKVRQACSDTLALPQEHVRLAIN